MRATKSTALVFLFLASTGTSAYAQSFDADARMAITLDREQIRFADSGGTQTDIIADLSNGDPERLRLQTTDYQFNLTAYFPLSSPLTSTQALSYLRFAREVLAEPGSSASAYELGPSGGTLTINEIVPLGTHRWFRVRGTFAAEVCPPSANEADLPCRDMTGSFAFNLPAPPDGRVINGL